MASIREYFDLDPRCFTVHSDWVFTALDGSSESNIIAKVACDFEANARYWYFFVPSDIELSKCLSQLFRMREFQECMLGHDGDGLRMEMGHSDYSERHSTDTFQFTKRVHLYLDFELTRNDRKSLVDEAMSLGYYLSIRDREYARKRSETEKPLAFISHDSRDKDSFVRELVRELTKNYCTVWYDEYSLRVGDSLRESIEKGLRETQKCIVILSPNFLSNQGWGRAEFDSVFTREILEKQNVILPVWLDVGVTQVYEYSPRLADKVGLHASEGIETVAAKLSSVIRAV